MAKLRPRPPQEELVADPTICELQDRLRAAATSTSDVSPWCMSLLVWSYATLGMEDEVRFAVLLDAMEGFRAGKQARPSIECV